MVALKDHLSPKLEPCLDSISYAQCFPPLDPGHPHGHPQALASPSVKQNFTSCCRTLGGACDALLRSSAPWTGHPDSPTSFSLSYLQTITSAGTGDEANIAFLHDECNGLCLSPYPMRSGHVLNT